MDTLDKNLNELKTEDLSKLLKSKRDLPASPLISILRKHLEKIEVQNFLSHPRILPHLKYYLCNEEDDLCSWYLQLQNKDNSDLVKAVRSGDRAQITKAIKLCENRAALELYFAGLARQRLVPQKLTCSQLVEEPTKKVEVTKALILEVEDERQVKKQKHNSNDFTLDNLILEK